MSLTGGGRCRLRQEARTPVGSPTPEMHIPKWRTLPPAGIVAPQFGALTTPTGPTMASVPLHDWVIAVRAASVKLAVHVDTALVVGLAISSV